METKLHYGGGLRPKSKVPRVRCSQRLEYVDCSGSDFRNGSQRKESQGSYCQQVDDFDDLQDPQRLLVGERVCISGVKQGVLRYFGRTGFAQGLWCGIELDEPVGKNNGTVGGTIYFSCKPNHGIFAPVNKVSKLNDLNACTWQVESSESIMSNKSHEIQHNKNQGWDYKMSNFAQTEVLERKQVKNSASDPTILKATARTTLPRCSESFSHDTSNGECKNLSMSFKDEKNVEISDSSYKRSKSQSFNSSLTRSSSSSRNLSKFGYGAKHQYYSSNVIRSADNNGTKVSETDLHPRIRATSLQHSGLPSAMEEYEQYFKTTNSDHILPLPNETERFRDMPRFEHAKIPDNFFSTFQSQDFSDFDDDNDDLMSADYDESLGILTPSQMRDLTLGPSSLSDVKGLEFPNSESFDDINDLPEDEQVHDVSVFHLSNSLASRNVEVSKQIDPNKYNRNFIGTNENPEPVNGGKKFLCSTSKTDIKSNSVEYSSAAVKELVHSSSEFGRTYKINNIAVDDTSVSDKLKMHTVSSNDFDEVVPNFSQNCDQISPISNVTTFTQNLSSNLKQTMLLDQNISEFIRSDTKTNIKSETKEPILDETCAKSCEVLHSSNAVSKEKPTVSWEDCIAQSDDKYSHPERPESVYTVSSNDTGFHEDCELEGMTTSIDSTDDTKRFSTISRDSCVVSDDIDVYKIAESNSTSGYSTGLSDSCCNESKPLTDEEIQDSVGHCDSEDAFSLHENSLSKDPEIIFENSELTTETALMNNDSTSDAVCETMVEDTTLTEIHDLTLSPDDRSPTEAKDSNTSNEHSNAAMDELDETAKSSPTNESDASPGSSTQTTPERKINRSKIKTESPKTPQSAKTRPRAVKPVEGEAEKKSAVKSPKKNVMSKIKAMIESSSCKTKPEVSELPVSRKTVSAPRKSRWEAVTSKIAASLAEEKTKPKTKREIKSRVNTNLSSARQQPNVCQSPKLNSPRVSNCGDRSMSPLSVSSRERKPLTERNNAINAKEGRVKPNDTKQDSKSPRPGKLITSRSASPVAASESSTTSVSAKSHNSRSKIAHWKGSNSTIESSAPPAPAPPKRLPISGPIKATTPFPSTKATTSRATTAKKLTTVPKIRITPSTRSTSPPHSKQDRNRDPKRTKEQNGARGAHLAKPPVRPPMWLSKAELTQEIQRLGNLCEVRTKELNRLKMETKHVSVGFDAFAALFKYMVEDLNALSVPLLSEDLEKTLKQLELTKQDLAYYEREVEELKAHHCQELNDLSNKLFEVFQGEVTELSTKHQEEMTRLMNEHQKQIEKLSASFDATSEESLAKHEVIITKLQQELINQREELQLLQEKEILDLEEKHAQTTKTLQEHIEQLQKKCAELQQHSLGMEDAMRKDTDSKIQWVTERKVDLEKEVESLKAVLEMKNKELHTLRVQNLEMEKQLEDLPLARERIKMLQARAEDLEALMLEKTKLERKLSCENQHIKDTFEKESKVNKRLSMENEELQWRLRQAEQSLISSSFIDENPDEENMDSTSPTKSPAHQGTSRSVFFTFVDSNDTSSPKSAYKKITPGFASTYKSSPSRSCRSPPLLSPRRLKSHSEPPQPLVPASSTPRKVPKQLSGKQKGTPKRPRSGSESSRVTNEHAEVTFISVTGSMASSVSSESSVFENKDRLLLEDHKEEIFESLEILREQRESFTDEPITPEATHPDESPGFEATHPDESLGFEATHPDESPGFEATQSDESPGFETTHPDGSPGFEATHPDESPGFGTEDMSRSSEFSDPKTYYHMTFPVGMSCDARNADKDSQAAQQIHSTAENGNADIDAVTNSEIQPQELDVAGHMLRDVGGEQKQSLKSANSTDDMHSTDQNHVKDGWRTI